MEGIQDSGAELVGIEVEGIDEGLLVVGTLLGLCETDGEKLGVAEDGLELLGFAVEGEEEGLSV